MGSDRLRMDITDVQSHPSVDASVISSNNKQCEILASTIETWHTIFPATD